MMTPEEFQTLTWVGFKNMVMDHYFPQSYKDQKETEFLNLKQRTMFVVEYKRIFNQLSCYASYLVDTEERKTQHFERGLHQEIAGILVGLELATYAEGSRRAQAISTSLGLETTTHKQPNNFGKKK